MIKRNEIVDINKMDRLQVLLFIIIILTASILIKLFNLQILQGQKYLASAQNQHLLIEDMKPRRGEIFLSSASDVNYPLAINRAYLSLYAIPNSLTEDPLRVSRKLAEVLEMDEEILYYRLSKEDDIYEPIKSKLSKEEIEQIEKLDYDGIKFTEETYRYYPNSDIGSHVVGYVGWKNESLVGNYGLEGYWQEELAGEAATMIAEKDVYGNIITIGDNNDQNVVNGQDLYLTIDQAIQHFACEELKNSAEEYGASGGSVIVMNPKNGDILAMCNYPEFDPNNYSQVESIDIYNNDATFSAYEPGSVFKALTMAMGLDLELITPETNYFDTGEFEVEDYTIRNSDLEAHGNQTMVQVLDESLNTGAAWVAEKVNRKRFKTYTENFGFGEKTSLELDSEVRGDISNLDKTGRVFLATASYGQGITATPIQLASAFSSFANGGYLYKPRIVKKIVNPQGKEEEYLPELIRKVISERTAKQISAMLVSVIESGHAALAGVDGYYLGGKTGTAQVAKKGGYSRDNTVHTFIGFGPSRDPKFVILTKFDSPQRAWSALTAAPLFGKISRFILDYYKISPER
jgi:stage V sporulation protein D (sporulation-specific penicillin-binding protein)